MSGATFLNELVTGQQQAPHTTSAPRARAPANWPDYSELRAPKGTDAPWLRNSLHEGREKRGPNLASADSCPGCVAHQEGTKTEEGATAAGSGLLPLIILFPNPRVLTPIPPHTYPTPPGPRLSTYPPPHRPTVPFNPFTPPYPLTIHPDSP